MKRICAASLSRLRPSPCLTVFFLTFRSLCLAAPSNFVTIYDTSGSPQVNRPITISRVFAAGEILNYAHPQIAGVPLSSWQCDRKTSWPDGSLSHALISFTATLPANGSITVDFTNDTNSSSAGTALTQAQMVDFNSGDWGADIEATGSATCTGNQLSGNTCSANAKTMLSAGQWRYWLQGPVVTQVIVEDRSSALSYDFGWDNYKPIHPMFILTFYPSFQAGVKVDAILENDWTTKLEDQTYTIAMKSGASLSTTAYAQANITHWARARMRQTFWSGTPLSSINTDFNLAYMAYSGAIPNFDTTRQVGTTAVTLEHNEWSNSTGYAPFAFGQSYVQCPNDGPNGCAGQTTANMTATGGRPTIGIIPRPYVRWLYTMANNNGLYQQMIGNAEIGGQVPWHYRESATGRNYEDLTLDPGHANAAFGRWYSQDARPHISLGFSNVSASSSDAISAVGQVNCSNGAAGQSGVPCTTYSGGPNYWGTDPSHHPALDYLPYLVTGDYYYLEEVQALAAWVIGFGNYQCGSLYGSCAPEGILSEGGMQERGMGWSFRSLAEAAFISPDGSPERAYFTEKLNNNIEEKEGQYNLQSGSFYHPNPGGTSANPCPNFDASSSTIWCQGYVTYANWANNPNPLAMPLYTNNGLLEGADTTKAGAGAAAWHYWYAFTSWGHTRDLGFKINQFLDYVAKNPIHQALDPNYVPILATAYMMPVMDKTSPSASPGGCCFFTSWSDVKNAFSFTSGTLASLISTSDTAIPIQVSNYDSTWGSVFFNFGSVQIFGAVVDVDSEKIAFCYDTTGTSLNASFTGSCSTNNAVPASGRGWGGTTPTSHASGTTFTLDSNSMPLIATVDNGYGVLFEAALSQIPNASDAGLSGLAAFNKIDGMQPAMYRAELGQNSPDCSTNLPNSGKIDNCDNPKWAFLPRVYTPPQSSNNLCDLDGDGAVNTTDVTIAVGQVLGSASCTSLAGITGVCDVTAVQRIINAALGGTCRVGQ